MKEEIEHIKRWAAQDHTGLSARDVADAVMRMCDDALAAPPPQVARGERQYIQNGSGSVACVPAHLEYPANSEWRRISKESYDAVVKFSAGGRVSDEVFRANAEKLAALVLRTYNEFGYLKPNASGEMIEEVSRLAALLSPKAPAP